MKEISYEQTKTYIYEDFYSNILSELITYKLIQYINIIP